jgi:Ca-activated chloride channel family protein
LPVADVYPQQIPDLFSAKPLVLSGRYTAGGRGVISLRGKRAGQNFVREIPLDLPESQPQHDVLATLWARTRIDDLMSQDYSGMQRGAMKPEVREAITQLGLEYRLMTQFTSFVAVEETIVTEGGQPRRIDVPVEMPEGVSYEGVFGEKREQRRISASPKKAQFSTAAPSAAMPSPRADSSTQAIIVREKNKAPRDGSRVGSGSGSGVGQGRGGNAGGGKMGLGGGLASLPAEDEKRQRAPSKLHPSISAVIERLKNKQTQPTAEEAKFVRDGKAEIQIWLADKSQGTIEQLRKLGFEVILNPQSSKLIIGRLPIEKLSALAELAAVKYITPQTR